MSEIKSSILFVVVLIISSTLAQNEDGDSCISERAGVIGRCTNVGDCNEALEDIKTGLFPQICGYNGSVPIVCCTKITSQPETTTTPNSITTTTSKSISRPDPEADCPPLPEKALKVKKTGQKAWDYCIDLANTIFRCKKSLLLGGPRERQELCSHYVEGLVVGGEDAEKNEFPHMALLGYGDLNTAVWERGGTLLNKRWVLTAAHCLFNRKLGSNVQFVRLGSPQVNARIDRSKLYNVKQIVEHPDYPTLVGTQQQYNDIALLQLDRDASFGPSVIPACLPIGPADTEKAVVTGWGLLKWKGARSNSLQKVRLDYFSHSECASIYPQSYKKLKGIENETQLCYGSRKEAIDSCEGDSGGPLQVKNRNVYCTYTVIGIVATGNGCAIIGYPGIYTRVAAFIPWIESIVWP